MKYHCPDCLKEVDKDTFGYPVCCGATMKVGSAPNPVNRIVTMNRSDGGFQAAKTNQQLYDMVKELDAYCRDNDVSDWELGFIADMADKVRLKEGFYGKQSEHVVRLWEKYCK